MPRHDYESTCCIRGTGTAGRPAFTTSRIRSGEYSLVVVEQHAPKRAKHISDTDVNADGFGSPPALQEVLNCRFDYQQELAAERSRIDSRMYQSLFQAATK
jgi:hypothetical protein